MPRVLNRRTDTLTYNSVFIDRSTVYGNLFYIGKDGTREEVVEKHKIDLCRRIKKNPDILKRIIRDLKDKDLVCWCKPLACHGDFLLVLANGTFENGMKLIKETLDKTEDIRKGASTCRSILTPMREAGEEGGVSGMDDNLKKMSTKQLAELEIDPSWFACQVADELGKRALAAEEELADIKEKMLRLREELRREASGGRTVG